jgi:hypothetical protein
VAPLETPPGEDQTARPPEAEGATTRVRRRGRFVELEQHELITLLDEINDERSKARFREAIYISIIVWLVFGWVIVYGPRYLWHAPVIINPPEEKSATMKYLDIPPNLQQQLKRLKPTPNISQHDTEAQSPKPSPKAPEPKAGAPAPAPSPVPQPQTPPQVQQQQQPQQARNTPPTPTPPQPRPSPAQPLADAPAPSSNRPIFTGQKSAGDAIQQAARGSRNSEPGDYGSTGNGQQGGAKEGYQIISDTQGVDFSKYIARLLADVKRNWLPLIPEECRPPLNKQGITGIRFTILPDGKIAPNSMHLDYSTHDDAINRAGWGSITGLGQAQPLPKEFKGPNLELRIEFRINKDSSDAQ